MKINYLTVIVISLFSCFSAFAQFNSANLKNEYEIHSGANVKSTKEEKRTQFLSSNNYMGYEFLWPKLEKGWQGKDPWIAINAQASYVRLGLGFGNATKVFGLDTIKQHGNFKSIGIFYNHPIHILKNLLVIEPEIGLDFMTAQFRDDREKDPNSVGFGITPGIGVKVGPLKVVGKYTTSFALNVTDKTNAWTGGMNYASLGVFFETGWGLMSPKRIVSKGFITTSSTSEYYLGTKFNTASVDPTDFVNVYRVVTVYSDHSMKSVIHDVRPFWYIAPKVNSSLMINKENGKTFQYGADLGFRSGMLGGDVFYQTGELGFSSPASKDDLKNQYGFSPDLNGTISSQSYGGKLGIELTSILTKMFVHSHENKKIYNATRFARILISYGMGVTNFKSKPSYNLAYGQDLLNNFYTLRPDLKPSESKIPGNEKNSVFNVFNVKLEMGNVSLGYEKYTYKTTPFANGNMLTLGYMIPPGRIAQKIKGLIIARKIVKENRKK